MHTYLRFRLWLHLALSVCGILGYEQTISPNISKNTYMLVFGCNVLCPRDMILSWRVSQTLSFALKIKAVAKEILVAMEIAMRHSWLAAGGDEVSTLIIFPFSWLLSPPITVSLHSAFEEVDYGKQAWKKRQLTCRARGWGAEKKGKGLGQVKKDWTSRHTVELGPSWDDVSHELVTGGSKKPQVGADSKKIEIGPRELCDSRISFPISQW